MSSKIFSLNCPYCWKAEGDVSPGFCAGVAGLGCVLPRGPGSGESAVAHKGSPLLLSGVELGGWSRGAWLLAPWVRWARCSVIAGWSPFSYCWHWGFVFSIQSGSEQRERCEGGCDLRRLWQWH